MKNRDVAVAWAGSRPAHMRNLRSDGSSLWSYHWYEIARHVGPGFVFVRHDDESYSPTTTRHISAAISAANFERARVFRVRGEHARGINAERMGQPDWSWISLCRWFDRFRSRQPSNWPPDDFLVRIREDASVSDKELKRMQGNGTVVPLIRLLPDYPGRGHLVANHRGRTGLVADLELLDRVMPEVPVSYRVSAPYRDGPLWFNALFWDARFEDIREAESWWPVATQFGEPPEPILPNWERYLKKEIER